jgi:putative transposase
MSRMTSRGRATVRQVCQAFGLSRQAYYAAARPVATIPAARRERAGAWATATELEAGIKHVVAAHPSWGVRKVWAVLRRAGTVASRKRVWAMMRGLGLVLPPVRERTPEHRRGQVIVPDSNRRWASDLTTVWTRHDGVAAVVPVVDCGDRVVLACGVSKRQEAPMVLTPVAEALDREFGHAGAVPMGLELLTDHGPQYTGSDCADLCRRWGLDHLLAPVGRPTGNAVAERVILTMKVELIWTRDWDTIAELRAAIEEWMVEYNEVRPHQALAWRTPAEQRSANLKSEHLRKAA